MKKGAVCKAAPFYKMKTLWGILLRKETINDKINNDEIYEKYLKFYAKIRR